MGSISVDKYHHVGLDVGYCPSQRQAFTASTVADDLSAGRSGECRRAVAGTAIDDQDAVCMSETGRDDRLNRSSLVLCRNYDRRVLSHSGLNPNALENVCLC